jgi:hypothetical protein
MNSSKGISKMKDNINLVASIGLTILALLVGLFGIVVFIGVGEGTNNGLLAFGAVSLLFALMAGLFSWIAPSARWAIVIFMSAPVVILCVMGASMGWFYLPGAAWTFLVTSLGAYLGERLKLGRSAREETPPL